jgi:hypothetical protein
MWLGCTSLVAMMKPTYFRDLNNHAPFRWLHFSRIWRILVQCEMATAVVVVRKIGSKRGPKRFLVDRDDVIEALSAHGSNQALNIGRLPWGSRCGKHLLDPHVLQSLSNILAIDAISIPEYILRNGVIRKGLKKLLRSPLGDWMRRNVEVKDAATLMRENNEDIENAEGDCRYGEEINRGKLLGVVFQKCSPSLRGRFGMSDHVLSDGCLGDIGTEFEQFAMDSRCSPGKISFAHGADEFTNIS